MKRMTAAFASLAAAVAFAQQVQMPKDLQPAPSERPFSITRSSTGYLVGGNLGGNLWAFHVRGQEFKWLREPAQLFAIDGVVMQVKLVKRSLFPVTGPSVLQAHRKYEQEYQAKSTPGVTFADHDMCRNSKLPHQHWLATSGNISQAYVTFEVGDYVVLVVAPYENEVRREAVARELDDVCRSFVREKVGG